jgi:hypothetical protein
VDRVAVAAQAVPVTRVRVSEFVTDSKPEALKFTGE